MQLCEQKKCYVYKRLNFLCYQNKNVFDNKVYMFMSTDIVPFQGNNIQYFVT